MAYTFTLLTSGAITTGPFSQIVTASVTPTGPVTLGLFADQSTVTPTVSGCGLTWQLVTSEGGLYEWLGTGTPTAGTITIDAPGATWAHAGWQAYQIDGAGSGVYVDTNVVKGTVKSDGTTPIAYTYPQPFGAGSGGFAFIGDISGSGPESVSTGWTPGTVRAISGFGSLRAYWRADAATEISVVESSAVNVSGIAIEIASASSPPTVTISSPSAASVTVPAGTKIQLEFGADSPQDGDVTASAEVTSSNTADGTAGSLGTGSPLTIDTTGWADGTRRIAATVTDSVPLTGSDDFELTIGAAATGGFDKARFIIHALGGIA